MMSLRFLTPVRARLLGGSALALAAVALVNSAAFAQTTAANVESVVVTGSRLPSTFEAPTPVTVLDATQIRQAGSVNVEDVMNQTPQFRRVARTAIRVLFHHELDQRADGL